MRIETRLRHCWWTLRKLANAGLVLWLCFSLLTACDGSLAQALQPDSPEPQAGLREYQGPLLRPVAGGLVNTAGGNLFVPLRGLSLDTALGREEVTPNYNSADNRWRFGAASMRYDGATFLDDSGSEYDVTALPDGAAIRGSIWIKIDSDTIQSRGGLRFDFAGGALVAKHKLGQECPRITYDAVPEASQLVIRQQACSLRGEWSVFNAELFTLTLDAVGRVVAVLDRAGRSAYYVYDAYGNLVTARDGLDVERGWPGTRLEYAPFGGPLTALENSEGERIEYEYYRVASLGEPRLQYATRIARAGEGDLRVRFDYYAGFAPGSGETVVTDPLGESERYSFDSDRRVLRIDYDAVAESESFSYADAALRPSSFTAASGVRESYTRDERGDILTITRPGGNVVVNSYADANGPSPLQRALASTSDELGPIASWTYTQDTPVDYKRLATHTNGEDETTHYSYHPHGGYTRLAAVALPSGVVRELSEYDALGHPTRIGHGPLGGGADYDAVGNRTSGSDGSAPEHGGVLARRFDADRNPVEVTIADSDGTPTAVQLERGSDGRIVSIDRPPLGLGVGPDHRFTYDTLGRVTLREEWSNGAWQPTSYGHDARGRTLESLPNGMRREWRRDQRGRVREYRSYRDEVLEGEILFTYANGLLVEIDDSERGREIYSYDAVTGLPSLVQYEGGEAIAFDFDVRSRLTKETFLAPDTSVVKVVEYGYDLANRQIRIIDSGEVVIERSFSGGRLDCIATGNGLERCFSYEPVLGLRDGATTTNASLEVVESTLLDSGFSEQSSVWEFFATTDVPELGSVQATFTVGPATAPGVPGSEVGKRVSSWSNGLGYSEAYSYDGMSNQIDDADGDVYVYDSEGSRLLEATVGGASVSYSYDAAGFATARNGLPIEWTASGRMAAHDGYEADWDLQGRLLRVRDTNVLPPSVRDWSRWGGRIEVDGDGLLVALDLGVVVLGFEGDRRYRHFDFRGNVSFVSDAAGAIVTLYEYAAYGLKAVLGDGGDATRFVGKSAFGPFMLLGARMLDPLVGRFLSPDPVFNLLNQYTYTLGNPIWFSDPNGLEATTSQAVDVGLAAMMLTLSIVGIAMAGTGLGLGIAIVAFPVAIYEFGKAVSVDTSGVSVSPVQLPGNTGCDCARVVEFTLETAGVQGPAAAAPAGSGDNGGDSGVAPPGTGSGGFGGGISGGVGGVGNVPACGLTGIEFLFFVGWLLRRRKKGRRI